MIVEIGPEHWSVWRELRLRSLNENPEAFASSIVAWTGPLDTESRWRDRLASPGACFVANVRQVPIGMAAALPSENTVELISMWVAAEARGAGVGRALVGAVLNWAGAFGAASIRLRVMDGNSAAAELYADCGFVFDDHCVDPEGCRAMTYRAT